MVLVVNGISTIIMHKYDIKCNYNVIKGRTTKDDSVLYALEKTYPDYSLCSYENLGRVTRKFKITNSSRFWNERCEEVLKPIHDINQTFHYFPESYQEKMILSREIQVLFETNIFSNLKKKIKDKKNPKPKDTAMMIKLCSRFMDIGLTGMLQTMPSDFIHILTPKVQELFTLMSAINQYAERIAPSFAKSTEFPFDMYEKSIKKQLKKEKKTT